MKLTSLVSSILILTLGCGNLTQANKTTEDNNLSLHQPITNPTTFKDIKPYIDYEKLYEELQEYIKNLLSERLPQPTNDPVSVFNQFQNKIRETVSLTLPSVAHIEVYEKVRHPRRGVGEGTGNGTGVVYTQDGYIITCDHVVGDHSGTGIIVEEKRITVKFQNTQKEYPATVVGTDPLADIAVIKINETNLTPAKLADLNSVKLGDFVIAAGGPFGLSWSYSFGIVSALNRYKEMQNYEPYAEYKNYIQIDAALNYGNSGGPLFDINGQLIGINNSIYSPDDNGGSVGIGFAIPLDRVLRSVNDIIKFGKVIRGYAGISVRNLNKIEKESITTQGAYITEIIAGSAASTSELQTGDIITSINEIPISQSTEITYIISMMYPGEIINIEYLRKLDGELIKKNTSITLREMPVNL
ncbi:MAG: trypsin-like peptidase domain-containing protein [Nitrososphaerota archaeon]